jgi:hypothetical protein
MEPLIWAALIAAIPTTLAIFGGMGRYIVTTILDAYKAQAAATVAAKDAEIHMLERLLADERSTRTEDKSERERLHAVIDDLRSTLTALGGS